MATRTSRTTTLEVTRLRLVETEHEFTDDEPPSLTAIPATDTTGEIVSETTRPLAKTADDYFPWAKRAVGR